MKTNTKIFAGITAVAILLSSTGAVFAGTELIANGAGYGRGIGDNQDGLLEPYMDAAIAEELGLTVEQLDALLAEGETHYTIALDLGFTEEEFTIILKNAQETAAAMAAEDGIIINQFGNSKTNASQYRARLMDPEDCLDGTYASPSSSADMRRGGRR